MKYLLMFENFSPLNNIFNEVKSLISPLRRFGYQCEVTINSGLLNIEIAKSKNSELRVFLSSDVTPIVTDIDKYLTLGEGFALDGIFIESVNGSREVQTIRTLSRERDSLLTVVISYRIPQDL